MAVPPLVAGLLRSSAPTLLAALALPPPFNFIASAVASVAMRRYLPGGEAEPDPNAPPGTAPPAPRATPEALTEALTRNATNPEIIRDLQKAEADLKRYEMENNLKFAELEVRNLEGIRSFQSGTGIAADVLGLGKRIIWIALVSLGLVILGAFALVVFANRIPAANQGLLTAVFGLVGTAVGFINGVASQVVSYYYGSSQGSKEKTDALTANLRQAGETLSHAMPQGAQAAAAPVPAGAPEAA
uniref:hypothetical protein n=1 Tax=Falsiroseomonas oryzae TaxID=2766473 RepID=UPI0022EAF980